jgi:hypothetical protein
LFFFIFFDLYWLLDSQTAFLELHDAKDKPVTRTRKERKMDTLRRVLIIGPLLMDMTGQI